MTPEERKAIDDALAERHRQEEIIHQLEQQVRDIKAALSSCDSDIGDWKVTKSIEYQLAGKEVPYDMVELDRNRQSARDQIDALNEEIKEKYDDLPEIDIPDDYWDYEPEPEPPIDTEENPKAE